ncbi:hypothetical protein T439DRAFT_382057 [Meredithblackwellia eburnea MCA 4105]
MSDSSHSLLRHGSVHHTPRPPSRSPPSPPTISHNHGAEQQLFSDLDPAFFRGFDNLKASLDETDAKLADMDTKFGLERPTRERKRDRVRNWYRGTTNPFVAKPRDSRAAQFLKPHAKRAYNQLRRVKGRFTPKEVSTNPARHNTISSPIRNPPQAVGGSLPSTQDHQQAQDGLQTVDRHPDPWDLFEPRDEGRQHSLSAVSRTSSSHGSQASRQTPPAYRQRFLGLARSFSDEENGEEDRRNTFGWTPQMFPEPSAPAHHPKQQVLRRAGTVHSVYPKLEGVEQDSRPVSGHEDNGSVRTRKIEPDRQSIISHAQSHDELHHLTHERRGVFNTFAVGKRSGEYALHRFEAGERAKQLLLAHLNQGSS